MNENNRYQHNMDKRQVFYGWYTVINNFYFFDMNKIFYEQKRNI